MYANKKMNRIISSVGVVLFAIITTGAAAVSIVLESGIINVSHAQLLQRPISTGSEVTTPGANPMCDPTDTSINTTESHVCGLPKTPSVTAAEPSSITPGANPMCDPTDTSINTTESHVCGLPKTPSVTAAKPESTTTEPPVSVSPSSPGSTTTSPPPPPSSGTQESPIPGLPGLQ
jgi:hypothetical protein